MKLDVGLDLHMESLQSAVGKYGLLTRADEHVLKKNRKSTHFNVYDLKRCEGLLGGYLIIAARRDEEPA